MRTGRWVVIGLVCVLLTGCSTIQQQADDIAAASADYTMVDVLTEVIAASDAQTPEERVAAAEDWLSDPYRGRSSLDNRGAVWVTRGRQGAKIRIDLYSFEESASLLPPDAGESAWGVACRTYDVAEGVTVITIECPDGTPADAPWTRKRTRPVCGDLAVRGGPHA